MAQRPKQETVRDQQVRPDKFHGNLPAAGSLLLGLHGGERLQLRQRINPAAGACMSHDHHGNPHDSHHDEPHRDPDPADSRADAIAAFCALAIAVCGILYFVSHHA